MKAHPAAELFPMMEMAELQELANDIKEHGQQQDIILLDGAILDGRNRYKACEIAGVEPQMREYAGNLTPVAYVLSQNLHRRHLTASQKSMIAAAAKPMFAAEAKERQRVRKGDQPGASVETLPPLETGKARDKAAAAVGVNPRYVDQAEYVLKNAPEVAEKVKSGEVSLPSALRMLSTDPDCADNDDGEKTKRRYLKMVSTAVEFAQMAIIDLERIRPTDPKRAEALGLVEQWIEKHR